MRATFYFNAGAEATATSQNAQRLGELEQMYALSECARGTRFRRVARK